MKKLERDRSYNHEFNREEYVQRLHDFVTVGNCPNITNRHGIDCCRESERPSGRIKTCHLVSGDTCEEWNEIKKEWRNEDDNNG